VTTDDSKSRSDSGFAQGDPSHVPRRLTTRQRDDRLQAIRHGELAGDELQAQVVAALAETERILTETPIDGALLSNGWSERRAHGFAAHLAEIRAMVEDGRYRVNSRYPELSLTEERWATQFDPKTRDALQDAILEVQALLRVASLQSHPS
jgi:hypothetical protein